MENLVEAERLALGYAGRALLSDVRFSLAKGEILAVVGHNGSGKSTFVKTLLGVIPPIRGRFQWPMGRPPEIAYLGQLTDFDRRFPLRVRDLAAMGAWRGLGMLDGIDAEKRALIGHALEQAGVADLAERSIHELSAGQLQRTLFARAIVQDAPLILLDEPFAAVDQTTEERLLQLIDGWAAEGRAVLMVLHDLTAVLKHCDHALLLGAGKSYFAAPSDALTPERLVAHSYLTPSQSEWLRHLYQGAGHA